MRKKCAKIQVPLVESAKWIIIIDNY